MNLLGKDVDLFEETLKCAKILISRLWLPGVCSVVWYKPVFGRLG
jgi:hypothetical protein